jgi:hypothetical protein
MSSRAPRVLSFVAALLPAWLMPPAACACCPAPPSGKPVVNADQTVVIVWDAATKTEHFIRKASFKSDADDFGFLVPTPSQPDLEESGNEAFPYLLRLTEPERRRVTRPSGGGGCGCGGEKSKTHTDSAPKVTVLLEKEVAGFQATVLQADSTDVLVSWLKEHGYAFSPEVAAWARPYVGNDWKITAMKVARDKQGEQKQNVAAAALRISFQTDRPLFPYREPESSSAAKALNAKSRLLRIYFIAEGRYRGELTKESPWTGKVAWSNPLTAQQRQHALDLLKLPLPKSAGPEQWWLTEFEDPWPYATAPADLYFARDSNQATLRRQAIVEYASVSWPTDVAVLALAFILALPHLRHWRKG